MTTDADCIKIMRRCPRYERCSAPFCPLDLRQNERVILPGEPRCTLGRRRRMEAGAGTALPLQGMTAREAAARARWDALSDEERAARKAAGKANLARFVVHSEADSPACVPHDETPGETHSLQEMPISALRAAIPRRKPADPT